MSRNGPFTQLSSAENKSFLGSSMENITNSANERKLKQDPEERKRNLISILGVIEDVFCNSLQQSSLTVPQKIPRSARASSGPATMPTLPEVFYYNIHLISMQIIREHSKGTTTDQIIKGISDTLGAEDFLVEEKVVLVLAAFAVTYGKFWLTIHQVEENQLLRSVSTFRRLLWLQGCDLVPTIPLGDLTNLINWMLDLAYCMIELIGTVLQSHSEVQNSYTLIIEIVVWCICMETEYTKSIEKKLKFYIEQLTSEHASLYAKLKEILISAVGNYWKDPCVDITSRIKKFFVSEDSLVMCTYSESSEDCLHKLEGHRVALFISDFDLDLNSEEYYLLVETYYKIKEGDSGKDFEIVWMPMADRSIQEADVKYIINKRAELMPWCFHCYPTSLNDSFRSYIREKWNFQKKPILVILDNKGEVDCTDAFPLVTVFGDLAYPFTSSGAQLWEKTSWSVEFLVKNIDPQIPAMRGPTAKRTREAFLGLGNRGTELIKKLHGGNIVTLDIEHKKLVCFYGGDDLTWIRNFAKTMRKVMKGTGVRMNLIYIGMSGRRDKLQDILAAIAQESISQCWSEVMIRSFWFRFQSIFDSRMQSYNITAESVEDTVTKSKAFEDTIIKELMPISTYDSSNLGWAMMFRGSGNIVKASGKQLMELLESFESWSENIHGPEDFLAVLTKQMNSHRTDKHCIRSKVQLKGWFNPGDMTCSVCGDIMEKQCVYSCCKE